METLADIMLGRGCPEYIRSDNGPEFIAKKLRSWLSSLGADQSSVESGKTHDTNNTVLLLAARGVFWLFQSLFHRQ